MLIGYARVSTDAQDTALQIDALKKYGVKELFQDKKSGKSLDGRAGLKLAINALGAGDTLVVYDTSRLSRNVKDVLAIRTILESKKAKLHSIADGGSFDTSSSRMISTIMASINEFDRESRIKKIKDGIAAKKARGFSHGRPAQITDKTRGEIINFLKTSRPVNGRMKRPTVKEAAEMFGVSISTVNKFKKEKLLKKRL
jgi:DNA invertase Pin-like site-specific DNA recombinase